MPTLAFVISSQYSLLLIILCPVAGLVYAYILYRKDKNLNQAPKYIKPALFAVRALAISLICFLLLSPVINTEGQRIEEPLIIFAQDVSESVAADTTGLAELIKTIDGSLIDIQENFQTKVYSFGEELRGGIEYSFSDKLTNISEALETIQARYYNRNVGALVLASDGIYNAGRNPIYFASQFNFPIYTVAMGSTEAKKDLIMRDVEYNKIVFLNDIYPLRVNIEAKKLQGETGQLSVFDNGKLIEKQSFNINSEDFYATIELEAKAEQVGIRRLRFVLDPIEGEFSIQNNQREIIFEVIDSKQKILLLANSPHPDIAAIKSSLDENKNFETHFATVGNHKNPLASYNLVILHQLPSNRHTIVNELQAIRTHSIPTLWIIGKQSNIPVFNTTPAGLTIQQQARSFDQASGKLNPKFALFELLPEINNLLLHAPPLETPFGQYTGFNKNEILFYRTIRGVDTESPLFVFDSGQASGRKSAVLAGEGIWRWKIYDYRIHQNHILFNELIQKTAQFLSLKVDKDRFRVETEKIISENQDVIFRAERYNKSYELINEADVNIELKDSVGDTYFFTLDKTRYSYELNIGKLPAGSYTWQAETLTDNKPDKKQGQISIQKINFEAHNMQANHRLLYTISELTGGKTFTLPQIGSIADSLKNDSRIKPLSHSEKTAYKVAHSKLLFFLIVFLLIGEWFVRKYAGSY